MHAHTLFPLYSSDALAPARALVDEVFNCDGGGQAAAGQSMHAHDGSTTRGRSRVDCRLRAAARC